MAGDGGREAGGHCVRGGVGYVRRILPPTAAPLRRSPGERCRRRPVPPRAPRGRREATGAMLGSGAKAAKPSFVSYISPEVRGRRGGRGGGP